MKTLQELADRRDQITAEQNKLCEVDVWTYEQMRKYHELEDERIAIVGLLADWERIENLKDDNADLARLIDQMSRWSFDITQVEERIAKNLKEITIIEKRINKWED